MPRVSIRLKLREQYEKQFKDFQKAYGGAMLELCARKNLGPAGCVGRELNRCIQQVILVEGIAVSIAKLCAWFGIPRRGAITSR